MSLNVKISPADLDDLRTPLMNLWYSMYMDAGDYNASEKAELVLDRIGGEAGEEVNRLIKLFGYDAVHAMVTMYFEGY